MTEIVFILGAGASWHATGLLMDNFLQRARELYRSGEVGEAQQDFKSVLGAVGMLRGLHSKAVLDLDNIETVYTAFEMGQLLGRLPGIEDADTIGSLTSSIRKLIGYTLENSMKLYQRGETDAPPAYYQFTDILTRLIRQRRDFAVITFNYDLGLDYSLVRRGLLPDYALNDVELRGRHVTLLKLHGSLNWGRCSNNECLKLTPYRQFQHAMYHPQGKYSILPVISNLKGMKCQCGAPLEEEPVLIPPTWNKTSFHGQIEQVWRNAADVLRDAEHIFVIGYSLPETDWFFNYLFALGVDMTTPVSQFYVVNSDGGVEKRFKDILGPDVSGKLLMDSITFEEFVRKPNPLWPDDSPQVIPVQRPGR